MVRHNLQVMPEEFQDLVYLIQADAGLALFQVPNKPQADSHSFGKFDLREFCSPSKFFDLLAQRSHVRILYHIRYIIYPRRDQYARKGIILNRGYLSSLRESSLRGLQWPVRLPSAMAEKTAPNCPPESNGQKWTVGPRVRRVTGAAPRSAPRPR